MGIDTVLHRRKVRWLNRGAPRINLPDDIERCIRYRDDRFSRQMPRCGKQDSHSLRSPRRLKGHDDFVVLTTGQVKFRCRQSRAACRPLTSARDRLVRCKLEPNPSPSGSAVAEVSSQGHYFRL